MFISTPSTDFFSLLQVVGNGIAWHTKLANYQNRKVYSKSSYTFPKSALTLVRKKKEFPNGNNFLQLPKKHFFQTKNFIYLLEKTNFLYLREKVKVFSFRCVFNMSLVFFIFPYFTFFSILNYAYFFPKSNLVATTWNKTYEDFFTF